MHFGAFWDTLMYSCTLYSVQIPSAGVDSKEALLTHFEKIGTEPQTHRQIHSQGCL